MIFHYQKVPVLNYFFRFVIGRGSEFLTVLSLILEVQSNQREKINTLHIKQIFKKKKHVSHYSKHFFTNNFVQIRLFTVTIHKFTQFLSFFKSKIVAAFKKFVGVSMLLCDPLTCKHRRNVAFFQERQRCDLRWGRAVYPAGNMS
jgi:hypothetical protein